MLLVVVKMMYFFFFFVFYFSFIFVFFFFVVEVPFRFFPRGSSITSEIDLCFCCVLFPDF